MSDARDMPPMKRSKCANIMYEHRKENYSTILYAGYLHQNGCRKMGLYSISINVIPFNQHNNHCVPHAFYKLRHIVLLSSYEIYCLLLLHISCIQYVSCIGVAFHRLGRVRRFNCQVTDRPSITRTDVIGKLPLQRQSQSESILSRGPFR